MATVADKLTVAEFERQYGEEKPYYKLEEVNTFAVLPAERIWSALVGSGRSNQIAAVIRGIQFGFPRV